MMTAHESPLAEFKPTNSYTTTPSQNTSRPTTPLTKTFGLFKILQHKYSTQTPQAVAVVRMADLESVFLFF